ncbi:MAG: hypothetical protein ACRENE_15320 [Polyangiaceae bacterium]
MRSRLLSSVALAAIASFIAAACSGNVGGSYYSGEYVETPYTGGGGDGIFPFSGPSCPNGPPGTERDVPCGKCTENACASTLSCAARDCADTYMCGCACPLNDIMCANSCPISQACMTCINAARACSDSAMTSAACSSLCSGI